ncbi:MAG TPA: Tol-Pal system beta propeller repeat protein TolB [Candidatus Angelobacter sp.]|nr:Tol-Pal system beta propeller repeat protein TolB [Candidatus Angelobacter sp.]
MLKAKWTIRAFLCTVLTFWVAAANGFQGKPIIEINQGQQTPRLAVPDFRASSSDAQTAPLNSVFNQTLWNDLDSSGVFAMVGKSFYPSQVPSQPSELKVVAWGSPPPNAGLLAFGNVGVTGGKVEVQGWLFDVKNAGAPPVLGKQYREDASVDNARLIAHRFADEIISRIGGIKGIAESKIYFISTRSGSKEVWSMDYDGANQQRLTHLNTIALSPRISPDRSRLAFSALTKDSWQIMMYSLELGRPVAFPRFAGDNISPAWSSDGSKVAFASSMHQGASSIFVSDASGGGSRRLTSGRVDVSPVFNPKTNGQIAFVSGQSGLPQIYIMDADGSNVQRVTDQGYAVSPSWSPNGMLLVFSWIRNYGPGVLGGADIYLMDIASRRIVQLTHDSGRNDFPSWSPDGRHIVYQSNIGGTEQIWSVLADGSHRQQLTREGRNSQPNWSFQ